MDIQSALSSLDSLTCQYAFYFRPQGGEPVFRSNCDRFPSASIIKVPILYAWVMLEREGLVNRNELCCLDDEPEVHGAGFSWLLKSRQIPYQDVLLMMIALSDNLCTNLVIQHIGVDRLHRVFHETLGLKNTEIQRKLFDLEARSRGLDNWISAGDCTLFYDILERFTPAERQWVESMLDVNQDDALLKRNIPRDTVQFFHKTGSITGVLHDWGYTASCQIFLLTREVTDEPPVFEVFGKLGELMKN